MWRKKSGNGEKGICPEQVAAKFRLNDLLMSKGGKRQRQFARSCRVAEGAKSRNVRLRVPGQISSAQEGGSGAIGDVRVRPIPDIAAPGQDRSYLGLAPPSIPMEFYVRL